MPVKRRKVEIFKDYAGNDRVVQGTYRSIAAK